MSMANTSPKADAEFTRALVRAMVIEGLFTLIGVVGIIMTQKPLALIVPVALGVIAFMVIFLPAFKAWRQREADVSGSQPPIVQDGGF
jgi:hypothetical protein